MKYYFLLFIIPLVLINRINAQQNDSIKLIEYHASSRASFIQIKISKNQLVYNESIKKLKDEEWNDLTTLIKSFELSSISKFEAPSNERYRDAAAAANLKIITSENEYETISFDHGNPPMEIAELIKSIISLADL